MKYFYQSNTKFYFADKGGTIFVYEGKGKPKNRGKNILKKAFPPPKEIPGSEVPADVKKKLDSMFESHEDDTVLKIKESFRLPGTDVIVEEGDRIRVLEKTDYRSLFSKFTHRKTDYAEAAEFRTESIGERYIEPLIDIAQSGSTLVVNGSAFDSEFPPTDEMEWIVQHEKYGLFYVNTEGYDYARYIFPLPDDLMDFFEDYL